MRHLITFTAFMALALAAACVPGGGGAGGAGGSPEAGTDAGCSPAPREYTGTWHLDDDSSEDCPELEATTSRFGDGAEEDCSPGCVCSRGLVEDGGACVAMVTEQCDDGQGETTVLVCTIGVASGGATRMSGLCGIEISFEGEVGLDCRYEVDFERTGD